MRRQRDPKRGAGRARGALHYVPVAVGGGQQFIGSGADHGSVEDWPCLKSVDALPEGVLPRLGRVQRNVLPRMEQH
jgi:hypothetical protein